MKLFVLLSPLLISLPVVNSVNGNLRSNRDKEGFRVLGEQEGLDTSYTIEEKGNGTLEDLKVANTDIQWRRSAIKRLWEMHDNENDFNTPLIKTTVPYDSNIQIYFKDETKTQTKSLKQRFAWMMYLWAVMEGHIKEDTHVYETSSGNTAIAEAYYAQQLGLKFTACVPSHTSSKKLELIKSYDGNIFFTGDSFDISICAGFAKNNPHGFLMDQGKNAMHGLDYFESKHPQEKHSAVNVMDSAMRQMVDEPNHIPTYAIHGVGSGGTGNSIGRYILRNELFTKYVVPGDEYALTIDYLATDSFHPPYPKIRKISGLVDGTAQMSYGSTTSMNREVVSEVLKVQGQASIAAMHMVTNVTGVAPGGSAGVNFYGAMVLAQRMHKEGQSGSILTLICDGMENYLDTYYNNTWLDLHNFTDMDYWMKEIEQLWNKAAE